MNTHTSVTDAGTLPRVIKDFELLDFGVDHCQYFPGVGTAYTDFDHVALGCGDNFREAFDDALENMAQSHDERLNLAKLESDISEEYDFASHNLESPGASEVYRKANHIDEDDDIDCELYYYVAIRYNL